MGKPTLAEIVGKPTAKQKKFAEGLVYGGLSKAESYRQAYQWNGGSKSGMRVEAAKAAGNPKISLAVKVMGEE